MYAFLMKYVFGQNISKDLNIKYIKKNSVSAPSSVKVNLNTLWGNCFKWPTFNVNTNIVFDDRNKCYKINIYLQVLKKKDEDEDFYPISFSNLLFKWTERKLYNFIAIPLHLLFRCSSYVIIIVVKLYRGWLLLDKDYDLQLNNYWK